MEERQLLLPRRGAEQVGGPASLPWRGGGVEGEAGLASLAASVPPRPHPALLGVSPGGQSWSRRISQLDRGGAGAGERSRGPSEGEPGSQPGRRPYHYSSQVSLGGGGVAALAPAQQADYHRYVYYNRLQNQVPAILTPVPLLTKKCCRPAGRGWTCCPSPSTSCRRSSTRSTSSGCSLRLASRAVSSLCKYQQTK